MMLTHIVLSGRDPYLEDYTSADESMMVRINFIASRYSVIKGSIIYPGRIPADSDGRCVQAYRTRGKLWI